MATPSSAGMVACAVCCVGCGLGSGWDARIARPFLAQARRASGLLAGSPSAGQTGAGGRAEPQPPRAATGRERGAVRLGLFGCLVADWFGRLVAVGCLRRCCLRARFLGRFVAEVGCVPCSVGGGRWFPVVLVVVGGLVGGFILAVQSSAASQLL